MNTIRNTAIAILIAIAAITSVFSAAAAPSAEFIRPQFGNAHRVDDSRPTGEFPHMCFDPLLSNVVITEVAGCGEAVVVVEKGENEITTITTTTVTADEPRNPVVVDDGGKSDKNHCNNGNGNGSEGCNASDKGNQDETEQKGDKADGRDNGDADNSNADNSNNGGNKGNN